MKDILLKQFKRMVLIGVISTIVGTLLLTLSFCIPKKNMIKNVASSLDYMIRSAEDFEDGTFSQYLWGHKETYTDAIMVQNAIEDQEGKNAFEQAMWAYHNDLNPEIWTPEQSIRAFCNDEWETGKHTLEYARYWHGYLIYLKPLLLLFSWKQLVWMGAFFQMALILAVVVLAVRKKCPDVAVAMLIGLCFTKPIIMMASLTMAVCSVLTFGSMLVMLSKNEWLEKGCKYPEFFLIIGILTAYFDFLTYPIVTLGFPLCTYFLMKKGEKIKTGFLKIVAYSICWAIGYAGMWAMKWIVADVTLHTGTIRDTVWSILGRTEVIGGRPRLNGGFYTISLNLQEYDSKWYLYGVIVLAAAALVATVASILKAGAAETIKNLVLYLTIFCIPFAWIIVVQHHSALHARFTFRIISVAAMALGCILVCGIKACKNKKNK